MHPIVFGTIETNRTPKCILDHYHGKVTVVDSPLTACSAGILGTWGFDWMEWSQSFSCLLPTCSINSITSLLFQNKGSLVVSVAMFSPAVYCWGDSRSLEKLTRMDGSDKKQNNICCNLPVCTFQQNRFHICLSVSVYPFLSSPLFSFSILHESSLFWAPIVIKSFVDALKSQRQIRCR